MDAAHLWGFRSEERADADSHTYARIARGLPGSVGFHGGHARDECFDTSSEPRLGRRRGIARLMTPLPKTQNALTRFALAHPIYYAISSGAVMVTWVMVLVGDLRAVIPVGIGIAVLQWGLWNRRGFLRRRSQRLYDEHGHLRTNQTPDQD